MDRSNLMRESQPWTDLPYEREQPWTDLPYERASHGQIYLMREREPAMDRFT